MVEKPLLRPRKNESDLEQSIRELSSNVRKMNEESSKCYQDFIGERIMVVTKGVYERYRSTCALVYIGTLERETNNNIYLNNYSGGCHHAKDDFKSDSSIVINKNEIISLNKNDK